MIRVEINNIEFFVQSGISVLEACEYVGIDIPRFCYHQDLSVAGNCRMCLIEISNSPKPVASCALPLLNNMKIYVDSPLVKKARENVLETLLLNHPLDCPICDQGGECDLQDQSKTYGISNSRFFFKKRRVEDKNFNYLIKTIMTRCIHCTRCVRFNTEISGNEFLGTLNRGSSTEIGSYNTNSTYISEISANVIDLCPVGALTSKNYSFKSRPWELKTVESIDLSDNLASNIYINYKESEILRVFPKTNYEINNNIISDKARYYFDYNNNNRLSKTNKNIEEYLTTSSLINKITFLTNNSLDFNNLYFLKHFENIALDKDFKFKSKTVNLSQHKSNFFINWLNSPILSLNLPIKTCLIISSKLRIENSIINTKLRIKQSQSNFKIFGFSTNYAQNYTMEYINLNVSNLYSVFEGKNKLISNSLIQTKNTLIIYGNLLFNRGLNKPYFINFIKKIMYNSILLNTYNACNLESINFLNYSKINTQDLTTSDCIFAINLEESFFIKKIFNSIPKTTKIIWINTQGSDLITKDNLSIPCTSEYEEEKVYFNLEERAQKTAKVFPPFSLNIKPIKAIIEDIYLKNLKQPNSSVYTKHVSYIKEMLNNLNIYYSLNNSKIYNWKALNKIIGYPKYYLSLYPIKNNIEDFYLSNKNLKNSRTMQLISHKLRKSYEFYK